MQCVADKGKSDDTLGDKSEPVFQEMPKSLDFFCLKVLYLKLLANIMTLKEIASAVAGSGSRYQQHLD